ncbi:MAG: hypothetical protein E7676_04690 [Ruminococcaceae bacterium]|nr:hypothetical protein [Oscillospiraceae bacterium]
MNSNFLKFKKRASKIRILKSALIGLSSGLLFGGAYLLLSRLAIIAPRPILALPIGIGVSLFAALVSFFALGVSDKSLAQKLDKEFYLNERIQTMIERSGEDSGILQMQREDAEASLSKIDVRRLKIRRLWIYITALALGACITALALIVPNMREGEVNDDPPFALSDMQRAGLNELVVKVENSQMQERYKTLIAAELRTLLSDLEKTTKMSVMRAELAESMAYILEVTCDSSSSAEILDALWKNGNFYLKHLAFALNTSDWEDDNPWGVYNEKIDAYEKIFHGEPTVAGEPLPDEEDMKAKLKGAIDNSALNISMALGSSGISEDDALRIALKRLATSDESDAKGYSVLKDAVSTLSYEQAKAELKKTIDAFSNEIFVALNTNKINADTGEYTITRLSTLFLVPAPEFERPDFVKYGQTIDDSLDDDDQNKEQGGSEGGGVGEGSIFGSNDLVLDPISGEYVEYGTLLDKYYAVVFEKLQNGSYSDEQKKMIENYFALLYGGLKKEEGK